MRRFIAIIYYREETISICFYICFYDRSGHIMIRNPNLNNFLYIQRMYYKADQDKSKSIDSIITISLESKTRKLVNWPTDTLLGLGSLVIFR